MANVKIDKKATEIINNLIIRYENFIFNYKIGFFKTRPLWLEITHLKRNTTLKRWDTKNREFIARHNEINKLFKDLKGVK